jgi:hypothetical protein
MAEWLQTASPEMFVMVTVVLVALLSMPQGAVARAGAPAELKQSAVTKTTKRVTDDDVRARVVDIQQTVDRMLADTTPAPTGTTGTAGTSAATGTTGTSGVANAVAVDRTRLLQLRQQLDALLAILNRR